MKRCGLFLVAIMLVATTAFAVSVPTGMYYTDVVGGGVGTTPSGYVRNDDGSSGVQNLGFSLNYFGTTYSTYYINTNGNISFGSPVGTYTPSPLNTTSVAKMIAPYWADLDTRPGNGGNVTVRTGANQVIITWDSVGYYANHVDKLVSFQLVLRSDDYAVPSDEGQIGFFYKLMQWETGDASGGSGGFGGTEATVGFGDGLSAVNTGEFSLMGSQNAGISGIVQNKHYWFNLNDQGVPDPVATPEPSTFVLIGAGIAGLALYRKRFQK